MGPAQTGAHDLNEAQAANAQILGSLAQLGTAQNQFDDFVLDPQLDLECLRIPHFYSAFYVYKYATGISAAVALSERVLSGESGSVDAYLNFLRSGGSKFPLEALKIAGVDMTTPAPIESALQLFERRLDELESLLL